LKNKRKEKKKKKEKKKGDTADTNDKKKNKVNKMKKNKKLDKTKESRDEKEEKKELKKEEKKEERPCDIYIRWTDEFWIGMYQPLMRLMEQHKEPKKSYFQHLGANLFQKRDPNSKFGLVDEDEDPNDSKRKKIRKERQ